jgi:hypothetical protein
MHPFDVPGHGDEAPLAADASDRLLAATYRAAAFFGLWPIAGSCSSDPVSHKRANQGTEQLSGQRFSLPSAQDYYLRESLPRYLEQLCRPRHTKLASTGS